MKAGSDNFNKAIAIMTENHTTTITINKPYSGNVSNSCALVIHECCASVINNLIEAGFSLSMGKHGMYVDDYGVK